MDLDFAPILSYKAVEPKTPYKASDAYNELFKQFTMVEGDAALKGTFTQPSSGWIFEKGFDAMNYQYDKTLSDERTYYFIENDVEE